MMILAAAHQAGWLGQSIDLCVEWLLANAQGLFDVIKVSVLALVSVTELVLGRVEATTMAGCARSYHIIVCDR